MKLTLLILAGVALALPAFAVTAPTVVQGTLYDQSLNPLVGGVINITYPNVCQEPDGRVVEAVFVNVPISSKGVFSVSLAPTDVCVPSGTSYVVTYSLPNGVTRASETWTVPTSATPVNLSAVVTFPSPIPAFVVALSVLGQAGATPGQCVTWNGTSWVPGSCGNLPNIITPGTFTKLTVNAMGLVTSGVQANFTDIAGSIQLTQTPLTTNYDLMTIIGGVLTRLPLIGPGLCYGNTGATIGGVACTGGGGSGTVINDVNLPVNQLVGGNGTVHVTAVNLSGDLSTAGGLATTLATVNSNIGSCGDATHVGQVTLNAKGLTTACTPVTITTSGSLPAATAQLQRLRIKANTGNLTTPEFASDYRFNIPDYNFPAQFPGGTLTAATPATVTLTPCPLGVATVGQTVYVSAGTGTAEAVKLTAGGTCTSGLATGTINFTPANTHTGGWAITSASAGTQEAVNAAGPNGGIVYGPQGVYDLYPPPIVGAGAVITAGTTIHGAGRFKTVFIVHSVSAGAFDCTGAGAHDNFEDIGIQATAQQVAGGYGIRLGNGGGNENTFSTINRIYCEPMYDCILAVNASNWSVNDSIFYNFSHTAITANDTTAPDNNGVSATGNTMFNYLLASHALACFYITSSGADTIIGNKCFGSTGGQLTYNVFASFPPNASPITTQLIVADNVFETVDFAAIEIDGTFNLVSITGNTIAQPGGLYNTYGLRAEDGGGSLLGTWQGTFTGNVIQGPGTGGSYYCAVFEGHSYNWVLEGNTCNLAANGFYTDANIKMTMGVNRFDNTTNPILGTPTNTTYKFTADIPWAQRPAAKNGSQLYFTDSNATCSAGGSTGQSCVLNSGVWTH